MEVMEICIINTLCGLDLSQSIAGKMILKSYVVVMEITIFADTQKNLITHFIEISSIGNVIHGHGASTKAQERLGKHFLVRIRNGNRNKKKNE